MEGMQESSVEEKGVITPETGLEIPKHLDVAELMKEKNAFFVHMIQVTNQLNVSENNRSGIDTTKLTTADKLDMVYGVSPTLSASTLRPNTNDGTFYGAFGVIFSHGQIESATEGDAGTRAISLTERDTGTIYNKAENINRAIDRRQFEGSGKTYNEIVLKNPEVGACFMKLNGMTKRTHYEDEEMNYFNGEKTVTKIGIVDFSNSVDSRGRQTGSTYDVPFSVLLEMNKHGKIMFMDEANQMYVISNID